VRKDMTISVKDGRVLRPLPSTGNRDAPMTLRGAIYSPFRAAHAGSPKAA
jgi:hypothetical protein